MSQDGDNGRDTLLLEDETLRHGFVIFPKSLIYARNLSAEAKMLYGVLVGYAFEKDHCFPGLERLCDDMGITANTLRLRMKELTAAAILKVKRRGQGKTNVYIIADLRNANFEYQKSSASRSAKSEFLDAQELRTKNRRIEIEKVEKEEVDGDSNPLQPLAVFDEEDRPIEAYLRGVAAELHDEAPFKSTLTRALKIWGDTELYSEEFVQKMGEAKKRTQKYSGSIRKKAEKASGLLPTKNKMPYFFSVLEDMLGLTRQGDDRRIT